MRLSATGSIVLLKEKGHKLNYVTMRLIPFFHLRGRLCKHTKCGHVMNAISSCNDLACVWLCYIMLQYGICRLFYSRVVMVSPLCCRVIAFMVSWCCVVALVLSLCCSRIFQAFKRPIAVHYACAYYKKCSLNQHTLQTLLVNMLSMPISVGLHLYAWYVSMSNFSILNALQHSLRTFHVRTNTEWP